ncbi:MAG TPA: phosphoserine transaminase [Stellaceae bacterium]|jgi:phosphoserine aminotransferase|nr:phosphoserine transaminase [Stellaceae bacterium]
MKPTRRPVNPCFSSGPCAKRPGWSPEALSQALLGRSHRSGPGKARLVEVIERSRAVLRMPADYRLGIVAASDTGAVEMALWSLLGARGIDLLSWENFGEGWVDDVARQLKLPDVRLMQAPYGKLPDLAAVDPGRDTVFVWNGTTAGVRVPNGDWIAGDRTGLTICDATSAAFAMRLPWDKLDVVTWSWQKALGGEAGHGMLALSPRAVERLQTYTPPWPLPKLFRLTSKGKLIEGVFQGETINTPSMLCVEDAIDSLKWAEGIGGLDALIDRVEGNLAVVAKWVERSSWLRFLAETPESRSPTSIQLAITDPWFDSLSEDARFKTVRAMTARLEAEGVGYDLASHRASPPGIRIWAGATVERNDVEALLPWLDWAWEQQRDAAKAV